MFPSLSQLHHATIITGNRSKNLELVKKYIQDQGIVIKANPDVSFFDDEQLLMKTVEEIVRSMTVKKLEQYRFCIISCDRVAGDVQNKLLKTLEEPQPGTYFFIIIPNTDQMLPTILSRCQIIDGDQSSGESRLDVGEFLKKNLGARFTYIETWTKAKKDEDNVSKGEVIHFLNNLEQVLWQEFQKNTFENAEQLFTDIRKTRDYAGIRGASHRVLLDFMAMICPILK